MKITRITVRRASWNCTTHHDIVTADGGYRREAGQAKPPDAPGLGLAPRLMVLGEPVAVYQ